MSDQSFNDSYQRILPFATPTHQYSVRKTRGEKGKINK
jgi:hypothetical protein